MVGPTPLFFPSFFVFFFLLFSLSRLDCSFRRRASFLEGVFFAFQMKPCTSFSPFFLQNVKALVDNGPGCCRRYSLNLFQSSRLFRDRHRLVRFLLGPYLHLLQQLLCFPRLKKLDGLHTGCQ